MNCYKCACVLSEEKMTFEIENEDKDLVEYRLCADCFDDKDEDDVLVAVWKFGTSVGVDEDEEFDVNDYKDYMFSYEGGEGSDCESECDDEEEKCEPKKAEIKVIRKFSCSTCGIEGHNKNNKKFHPIVPVCLPTTDEEDDSDSECGEEEPCFKCGNIGVFGETHFYAQPEKDGEENLYCNDCDVKSWYDN